MGWAKYTEDINELISERIMILNQSKIETEIKIEVHFEIPQKIASSNQNTEKGQEYSDIKIVCKDCGRPFLFSAKSQKHFEKQGWSNPKRCKCCREHRNTVFLMHASH